MGLEELGKKHEGDVCDPCKVKIENYMNKAGKIVLIRPLMVANKVQSLVCKDCKIKVIKNMR